MPYSAGSPSLAAAVVILAETLAKRRSQNRARASPTPAHALLTAAMIGTSYAHCQAKS